MVWAWTIGCIVLCIYSVFFGCFLKSSLLLFSELPIIWGNSFVFILTEEKNILDSYLFRGMTRYMQRLDLVWTV